MSVTPHISLRVEPERLSRWRASCQANGVDVSSQIRLLMDAWVQVDELQRSEEKHDAEEQIRLLYQVRGSLNS